MINYCIFLFVVKFYNNKNFLLIFLSVFNKLTNRNLVNNKNE